MHALLYLHAMHAFINDDFVPAANAVIPTNDLAINRGYGIFDFLKTVEGKPVFLTEHLHRFYFSASEMRLPMAYEKDQIRAIIHELIYRNGLTTSGIRLTLTGGASSDGYSTGKPNLVITQQPLKLPTIEDFDKGISLLSYPHQRQLPHVKTIDYLLPIWLQPFIKQSGADDLLYHQNGLISECPRANVLIVVADNHLITPNENILNGITRQKVLSLAKKFYKIEERTIHLDEIQSAKEVFITSSTKEILPVTAIDGIAVGTHKKEVSMHLRQLLLNEIENNKAS